MYIVCACIGSYADNAGQSPSSLNNKGAIIDDFMFQMAYNTPHKLDTNKAFLRCTCYLELY